MRLTKAIRKQLLLQNEGFSTSASFDSKNSEYERKYTIEGGRLHICENGKTSWADSNYSKEWYANDEETHRFLYKYKERLNTSGLE